MIKLVLIMIFREIEILGLMLIIIRRLFIKRVNT